MSDTLDPRLALQKKQRTPEEEEAARLRIDNEYRAEVGMPLVEVPEPANLTVPENQRWTPAVKPSDLAQALDLNKKLHMPVQLALGLVQAQPFDAEQVSRAANADYRRVIQELPGVSAWLDDAGNRVFAKEEFPLLMEAATKVGDQKQYQTFVQGVGENFWQFGSKAWAGYRTMYGGAAAAGWAIDKIGDEQAADELAKVGQELAISHAMEPPDLRAYRAEAGVLENQATAAGDEATTGVIGAGKAVGGLARTAGAIAKAEALRFTAGLFGQDPEEVLKRTGATEDVNAAAQQMIGGLQQAQGTMGKLDVAAGAVGQQAAHAAANPIDFAVTNAEQLANQLPTRLAQVAGYVYLGPGGIAAGNVASAPTEFMMESFEALSDGAGNFAPIDMTDRDAILAGLRRPGFKQEVLRRAIAKGIVTPLLGAAVDAMGVKAVAETLEKGGSKLLGKAVAAGAGMLEEGVSEGGSKFASTAAAKEDFSEGSFQLGGSASEAFMGGGFGGTTIWLGGQAVNKTGLNDFMQAKFDERTAAIRAKRAKEIHELARSMGIATTVPERLRDLLNSAYATGAVKVVSIPKVVWDQYWTAKGFDPALVARQHIGDQAYADAQENDLIEMDYGRAMVGLDDIHPGTFDELVSWMRFDGTTNLEEAITHLELIQARQEAEAVALEKANQEASKLSAEDELLAKEQDELGVPPDEQRRMEQPGKEEPLTDEQITAFYGNDPSLPHGQVLPNTIDAALSHMEDDRSHGDQEMAEVARGVAQRMFGTDTGKLEAPELAAFTREVFKEASAARTRTAAIEAAPATATAPKAEPMVGEDQRVAVAQAVAAAVEASASGASAESILPVALAAAGVDPATINMDALVAALRADPAGTAARLKAEAAVLRNRAIVGRRAEIAQRTTELAGTALTDKDVFNALVKTRRATMIASGADPQHAQAAAFLFAATIRERAKREGTTLAEAARRGNVNMAGPQGEQPTTVGERKEQGPNEPSGFLRVARHLTPAERGKLKSDVKGRILAQFDNLPADADLEAAALAGAVQKGWYERTANALLTLFGAHDAPRFAALAAALSPQDSVKSALIVAVNTWTNWLAAGRPTDTASIDAILAKSVMGKRGEASVLKARRDNVHRALQAEDAMALTLSGPKVNSFMHNLRGSVNEVTLDAWMANFALVDQEIFGGSINVAKTDPGKGAGYLAFSAKVRRVAAALTKKTGEKWTPAEVQETVWSWAKTAYEMADAKGETRSVRELVAQGAITDAAIVEQAADLQALLAKGGTLSAKLEAAGYGPQLDAVRAQEAKRAGVGAGPAAGSDGEGPVRRLAPGLIRSANRLDRLRRERAAAARVEAEAKRARQDAEIAQADAAANYGGEAPAVSAVAPRVPGDTEGPLADIAQGLVPSRQPVAGDRFVNLLPGLEFGDPAAVKIDKSIKVRGPHDAAALMAAFRSPFLEKMVAAAIAPDGTVRNVVLIAIGAIDQAVIYAMLDEKTRSVPSEKLAALFATLGLQPGDTLVLSHNHPSGNPMASSQDLALYADALKATNAAGAKFLGLVLDHSSFTTIDNNYDITTQPGKVGPRFKLHTGTGRYDYATPVAELASRLLPDNATAALIHLDTKNGLAGISLLPSDELDDRDAMRARIRREQAQVGAASTIIAVQNSETMWSQKAFKVARGQKRIIDVVALRPGSPRGFESAVTAGALHQFAGEDTQQGWHVGKVMEDIPGYANAEIQPPFYSHALREVEALQLRDPKAKYGAEQWMKTLAGFRVKAEELEWLRIKEWLEQQEAGIPFSTHPSTGWARAPGPVTVEEVRDFIEREQLVLVEHNLGATGAVEAGAPADQFVTPEGATFNDVVITDEFQKALEARIDQDTATYLSELEDEYVVVEEEGGDRTSVVWNIENGDGGWEGSFEERDEAEYEAEQMNEGYRENREEEYRDGIDRAQLALEVFTTGQWKGVPTAPRARRPAVYSDARYNLRGGIDYGEKVLALPRPMTPGQELFEDPDHFTGIRGAVGWFRHDTRIGPNGERVLFLQELQTGVHAAALKLRQREIETLMRERGINRQAAAAAVPVDFGYQGSTGSPEQIDEAEARLEAAREATVPARTEEIAAERLLFRGLEEYRGGLALIEVENALRAFAFDNASVPPTEDEIRRRLQPMFRSGPGRFFDEAQRAARLEAAKGYVRASMETRDAYHKVDAAVDAVVAARGGSPELVPNAPFKITIYDRLVQRAVRYAADHGFARVAWTTGTQQQQRWSLGDHVDLVVYDRHTGRLVGYKAGNEGGVHNGVTPEMLPKYVGKGVAQQLIEGAPVAPQSLASMPDRRGEVASSRFSNASSVTTVEGDGLNLGEQWPLALYDDKIAGAFAKIAAAHGGLDVVNLGRGGAGPALGTKEHRWEIGEQPSIAITPAVSQAAKAGKRLFQAAPEQLPVTISVNGVQRPTLNAEDSPIATTRQGVENFWIWFGDSDVVDHVGRPLVVYHGTRKPGFGEFDVSPQGDLGSHFTVEPAVANAIAGGDVRGEAGGVYPVYLRMANPLRLEDTGTWGPSVIADQLWEQGLIDADRLQEMRHFTREQMVAALQALGFDGVVYLNRREVLVGQEVRLPTQRLQKSLELSREGASDEDFLHEIPQARDSYIIFDAAHSKSAIGNEGGFDPKSPLLNLQTGRQKGEPPRGYLDLGALTRSGGRDFDFRLLAGADWSTVVHELGHYWLEILGDMAEAPGASDQVKADWDGVLRYLGVASRAEIGDAHHEYWAKSAEAYFAEGVAPSPELAGIFAAFRGFMVAVYRDVLQALGVELTDEVRGIMGRMLASEEASMAAQYEVGDEMRPEVLEQYDEATQKQLQAAAREAGDDAVAQLTAQQTAVFSDARKAALNRRIEAIRPMVAEQVERMPGSVALAKILQDQGPRLSRAEVKALLKGKGKTQKLRELEQTGALADDGLPLDTVAQLLGYESDAALIGDILTAANKKARIDKTARELAIAENPDLATPQGIGKQAKDFVVSGKRSQKLYAQLQATERLARLAQEVAGEEHDLRKKAEAKVERRDERQQRLRESVEAAGSKESFESIQAGVTATLNAMEFQQLKPYRFLADAKRESGLFTRSMLARNPAEAAKHKRRELIAHEKARQARLMIADAERTRGLAKRYLSPKAQATLGHAGSTYLDQMNGLLNDVALHKMSAPEMARRQKFVDWAEKQRQAGFQINVPQEMVDEASRKPFQRMTMGEIKALDEAMRNIFYVASTKDRLRLSGIERSFSRLSAEITEQIGKDKGLFPELHTPFERTLQAGLEVFAELTKRSSYVYQMDGYKYGGVVASGFEVPFNTAGAAEATMQAAAAKKFQELTSMYSDAERTSWFWKKRLVPGTTLSLTQEQRLAVLLNMGNDGNLQRLRNTYSDAELKAIIATLDARDARFVQGVWNYLGTYWSKIEAKEKRVYGVAPERVQFGLNEYTTALMQQTGVQLVGGYYPIVYSGSVAAIMSVADQAKAMMRGAASSAQTWRGFTKLRAESSDNKLWLDSMAPMFRHVNAVIHDLTHHEALIAVNRLMRHKGVRGAMEAHYGEHVVTQFSSSIEDIAAGVQAAHGRYEKVVSHLRTGHTMNALAWNAMSAVVQFTGLATSADRVGWHRLFIAQAKLFRSFTNQEKIIDEVRRRSPTMDNRGRTFMREANEVLNDLRKPRHVAQLEATMLWAVGKAQFYVDCVTWLAAYQQSMEETPGLDEVKAGEYADQVVLGTQGGGQVKDLARIQRGGPMMKLWTSFITYPITRYNLTRESLGKFGASDRGVTDALKLALSLLNTWIIPAILEEVIRARLKGDPWEPEKEAEKTGWNVLLGIFEPFPLVRDMVASIASGLYDYDGPAGTRWIQSGAKLWGDIVKDKDAHAAIMGAEVLGAVFHLPLTPVVRTARGINALTDEGAPVTAPVFGPPSKR